MTEQTQRDALDIELDQLDANGDLQFAFDTSKVENKPVAINQLTREVRNTTSNRIKLGSFVSSRRIATAVGASIFLAICLLPFLPGANQNQTALAWGEFLQRVDKVETIQYKETTSYPGTRNESKCVRVWILGKNRKRAEPIPPPKSGFDHLEDAFNQKFGIEEEDNFWIGISDLRTGKHVTLDPETKEYTLLTHQVVMSIKGEEVAKTKIGPAPEVDFRSRIRDIPSDLTTDLGKKEIEGRDAIGFGVVRKWGTDSTRSEEYWIDAETLLPLRIIASINSPDGLPCQTWTLSNFIFDQPLDEALFDTDPPEGYETKEGSIIGLDTD